MGRGSQKLKRTQLLRFWN